MHILQSSKHARTPPANAGDPCCVVCVCSQVRVVVKGVLVAAIALSGPGRLQPVRVCVDSADRASTVDPWTHSKHQVGTGVVGSGVGLLTQHLPDRQQP